MEGKSQGKREGGGPDAENGDRTGQFLWEMYFNKQRNAKWDEREKGNAWKVITRENGNKMYWYPYRGWLISLQWKINQLSPWLPLLEGKGQESTLARGGKRQRKIEEQRNPSLPIKPSKDKAKKEMPSGVMRI